MTLQTSQQPGLNRQQRRRQAQQGRKAARAGNGSGAADPRLQQAVDLHRGGDLDGAETLYQQILHSNPDDADVIHLLGVLARQRGKPDLALAMIDRAIALSPKIPSFQFNRAGVLRDLGRMSEAAEGYRATLALQPDNVEALFHLAQTLLLAEKFEAALEIVERALPLRPDAADLYKARGVAQFRLDSMDEALDSFEAALQRQPDDADTISHRGNTLHRLRRHDEALAAYDAAIARQPHAALFHNDRGVVLRHLGRLQESIDSLEAALRHDPNLAEAYNNLAVSLRETGQPQKALAAADRATQLRPSLAEAHSHRGDALRDLGRAEDSLAAYEAALRLDFASRPVLENLALTQHYAPSCGNADFLAAARRWAKRHGQPQPRRYENDRDGERRLRVGYLSGDLHNHPVGYFLEGVAAAHDPQAVELFFYSNRDKQDDVTERLQATGRWRNVVGVKAEEVAALIGDDAIDVLVDLSGFTAHNRLDVVTLRPAPVQLSWLGYFGTLGSPAIDALIADPTVIPSEEDEFYTETVLRLPDSYLCFTPPPIELPPSPPVVAERDGITFGSYNNLAKVSDAVIDLWIRVLEAVPGSRLVLKTKQLNDDCVRRDLLARFVSAGIDEQRIALAGGQPRQQLLRSYDDIDIALDPFPCGGGTTTVEALWMGVPVVTLRGDRFVGRVSASVLDTVGLPELVTEDTEGYLRTAVDLASDRERLAKLRGGLRARVAASPLCDAPRFTRHLETLYRDCWRRWCADPSDVPETN